VIDDYSRYIWAFPLCAMSETTMILRDFYQYALTQFHLPIQGIQCDNGREFDKHALHSFLSSKGIDFRLSCPHTSPQNGKAKRGIRTLCGLFCSKLN
jgi:transposase InsO family protein